MSEQTLYRMYNAMGDLLYVGITARPSTRITEHRDKAWWPEVHDVVYSPCESREVAREAERLSIATEAPRYNIRSMANDPVRTVRVSDELWEAVQEILMTRRPDESLDAWRARIKAGPSGLMRELLERFVEENR